jgi:pimeloyl-ACP methyl ester carboxylesterase
MGRWGVESLRALSDQRMTTLDDGAVSRVVFHPRCEPAGYSPVGMPTLTRCRDAQVSGYLHDNPASTTLLLFFHGNGEIAAEYDALASMYTGCGASLWVVDYRGYGRSSGRPSFFAMLEDAEALARDIPWIGGLAEKAFTRVIVMGRSLGSASAIHLASGYPDRVDGLILDSPYASGPDLIRRLGGPRLESEALEGFEDNIDKMASCTVPTLIIHGTHDQIIPVSDATALYGACRSEAKHLVKIEGAGHNSLLQVGYRRYWAEVAEHVARVARASRGE